jgi:DNA-binding NarL/FixJ family response regulator
MGLRSSGSVEAKPGWAVPLTFRGCLLTVIIVEPPVTVVVMANDPLLCRGAAAYLGTYPGITPVGPDGLDRADVVLVMAGEVTGETLSLLRHAAGQVPRRGIPFVLVCDDIRESQLLRALSWGMVSVLRREDTDYDRIVRTLVTARDGGAEGPRDAFGWLESRIRTIQRDVLDPRGLTPSGLSTREVDVLRLLAEGKDTLEIADQLNYSERTVRNIIHGVLTRMKLRNRVHAVAYALRSGVM